MRLFWGYWPSNNGSRDHSAKNKFVSLTKSIVLCTIGKRILCWSIFATEPAANFVCFWVIDLQRMVTRPWYKGNFASIEKLIVPPFLFADFEFLNLTWDLKVGVPRIGKNHQELFFKIGVLQQQLKSLKNSWWRAHFLVKLLAVGL